MKYIAFVFATLVSLSARADCNANGCTGPANKIFDRYYLTAMQDGQVYLKIKMDSTPLDCTLKEGSYMTIMSSHPLFKEIYSTLLSASLTDKSMYVRIKNGSSDCEVSYIMYYL